MECYLYWDTNLDGIWEEAAKEIPNGHKVSAGTIATWRIDVRIPSVVLFYAASKCMWLYFECIWATTVDGTNPIEREILRSSFSLEVKGAQAVDVPPRVLAGILPIPSVQLSQIRGPGSGDYDASAGSTAKLRFGVTNMGPGGLLIIKMEAYWDSNLDGIWELAYREITNDYFLGENQHAEWAFDLPIPSLIKAKNYRDGKSSSAIGEITFIAQCIYAATTDGRTVKSQHTRGGRFKLYVLNAKVEQTTTEEKATTQLPWFYLALAGSVIAVSGTLFYYARRRSWARGKTDSEPSHAHAAPQPSHKPESPSTMTQIEPDRRARTSEEAKSVAAAYCRYCGAKILPDSTFCGSCGEKL
jgi:hypothetical protein